LLEKAAQAKAAPAEGNEGEQSAATVAVEAETPEAANTESQAS
jgi:hypothetical protein